MSKGRSNWYEKKWSNRRALRADARRVAKRAQNSCIHYMPDVATAGTEAKLSLVTEVRSNGDVVIRSSGGRVMTCSPETRVVVGDYVDYEERSDHCRITSIQTRRSKLVRMRGDATRRSKFAQHEHVLAANIDIAVIVASAASPPFHPRLIDRYLILCQYGNIQPVIFINKIDLVDSLPDVSQYTNIEIPVIFGAATTGTHMDLLFEILQGKCSVLTGHSGVGKSTIFNALANAGIQKIGEMSGRHRGMHTTTESLLHVLDGKTFLIDTPGIRSLGLWDIPKHSVSSYFPEFATYARYCRFRNCRHLSEPDCAVREAVGNNEIPRPRYESYVRLMKE